MHSRQRDGVLWRVLPHNNSRILIHLAPSFAGATRLSRCLHTRKFWTPPPWPSSFQQFCPIQHVEYLDWWNTTFSFIQARRMTIVLLKIFLIRYICQIFFFIVFDPQEMSLDSDINMILFVKFSGVSTANICFRHWAATWWILERCSTQIPLAHHQFCRRFCIPTNFWTTRIFFPMQNLIEGSRSFYKGTVQNLIIRRPLCAEDWRLFYHQSKTNTSVNYFPNQLFSLHFQNDVLVFTKETWLKLVCSFFKANKGFPRSDIFLSLHTQRHLTFKTSLPPVLSCRRRQCWGSPLKSNSSLVLTSLWLFLHLILLASFWHHFRTICKTQMANVKLTPKMIPFVTCEISFCKDLRELVFGVDVFDLDFGVQINWIEQPIKGNSVGSGDISHCRASAFKWSSCSLLHCLQTHTIMLLVAEIGHLRERNQHYSSCRSSLEIVDFCQW